REQVEKMRIDRRHIGRDGDLQVLRRRWRRERQQRHGGDESRQADNSSKGEHGFLGVWEGGSTANLSQPAAGVKNAGCHPVILSSRHFVILTEAKNLLFFL